MEGNSSLGVALKGCPVMTKLAFCLTSIETFRLKSVFWSKLAVVTVMFICISSVEYEDRSSDFINNNCYRNRGWPTSSQSIVAETCCWRSSKLGSKGKSLMGVSIMLALPTGSSVRKRVVVFAFTFDWLR